MSASSLRARVRVEMIEEIKAAARKRLAVDGANLSLRGVARDMDIVASALYRYFPSRDDLLTALILEAYQSLGAAATTAAGEIPAADHRTRWLAVCTAVRDWATAHRPEYGLLYGNPLPGYSAPQDTVAPAAVVVLLLSEIAETAFASGKLTPPALPSALPGPVSDDLRTLIEDKGSALPAEVLDRVFAAWTQLFGLVTFETFGRLDGLVQARTDYFTHHMNLMADLVGLPAA
ncbi:TetR family transcriptional regulator [Nocardia sp. SYP-A9097]|uniref:TetR/AcrR family transcriptional regulator n=1 Tax=Nocardia sp. SYP-A9097 TaxID=2663237 RepID=UPI00129B35ED|nr:TetR/AcrR family transcriptional regulator [Nocardia sp. SYP-A9097]MRH91981.1 TetR family transcriptional regulator [Nocardia sp. SYP-A9097]